MSAFGPYQAVVTNVHDGDTISVDIKLAKLPRTTKPDIDIGFDFHVRPTGTWLIGQHVRLLGCNAPELATPDGQTAKAYIDTLVKTGDAVTLVSHGWDKFGGRIDGTVTLADGRDLAKAMIDGGHAKPWDGKGVKPV